jgi:hypothetical protein
MKGAYWASNNRVQPTRRSAPQRTGVQVLVGFCLNVGFSADVRVSRAADADVGLSTFICPCFCQETLCHQEPK